MVAEEVGPSGCEEGGTGTERQETRPWEYNPARKKAVDRDHAEDTHRRGGGEGGHSIPFAEAGTWGGRKVAGSTVAHNRGR